MRLKADIAVNVVVGVLVSLMAFPVRGIATGAEGEMGSGATPLVDLAYEAGAEASTRVFAVAEVQQSTRDTCRRGAEESRRICRAVGEGMPELEEACEEEYDDDIKACEILPDVPLSDEESEDVYTIFLGVLLLGLVGWAVYCKAQDPDCDDESARPATLTWTPRLAKDY